jgi:arginyl-tRNA synthetase
LIHEIATKFGEFYSACKILGSEEEKSRILLLLATKKVMETCFNLIGMKTIDKI